MIPAIYLKIKQKKNIPEDFIYFCKQIYLENKKRNIILLNEAKEISKEFSSNNIDIVFLKGLACIIHGIYDDVGERMVGDIDFLIKKDEVKKTETVLDNFGYNINKCDNFFNNRHLQRRTKNDRVFAIEPHIELLEKKTNLLTSNDVFDSSTEIDEHFVPSANMLLKHNILSYQINDLGSTTFNLNIRNLYDSFKIIRTIKDIDGLLLTDDIKNNLIVAKKFNIPVLSEFIIKKNHISKLRVESKFSSKLLFTIDRFMVKIYLKFNFVIKALLKFIKCKKYRKYIFNKL